MPGTRRIQVRVRSVHSRTDNDSGQRHLGPTNAGANSTALTFRRGLVSLRAQRRPIKRLRFWISRRSGVLDLGASCFLSEFQDLQLVSWSNSRIIARRGEDEN